MSNHTNVFAELCAALRDPNRMSPRLDLLVVFILTCFVVSAILVARAVPVTTVRRTVHVTEYKQRGPVDPEAACTTARVTILEVDAQHDLKKDEWNTWFVVRPVGDTYKINCRKGGNYDNVKPGDVFVLQGDSA